MTGLFERKIREIADHEQSPEGGEIDVGEKIIEKVVAEANKDFREAANNPNPLVSRTLMKKAIKDWFGE